MAKVAFLLSHIPNPRILKRIAELENEFDIHVIYWDRKVAISESFSINSQNNLHSICIEAPLGNPKARIIPFIKFMSRSLKLLKEQAPSIIHAGNLDMLMVAYVYKTFYDKSSKIVYEVADLPRYSFAKRITSTKDLIYKVLQCFEKRLTRSTSKIILTSPYFWESYYSKFMDESKYLFIPNAPLKSLFGSYEKQKKENFVVGFIGSVRYVNQLKMLIDVVGEIKSRIEVFIAGSGPGYVEISDYISDKPWVTMHGPYNYEKEIVGLYEKVDCVYSVYDTKLDNVRIALPNRLYEAIVCELPIIASEDTVLGKFIEDNRIGITIDSRDRNNLKNKLSMWASKPDLIEEYANNCRVIKDDYYYETNGYKLLDVYYQLVGHESTK